MHGNESAQPNKSRLFGAAAAAVGVALLAGSAQAASIVNLSLQVDPVAKTFAAYVDVEDAGSLGLHGINFNVVGSPGVTILLNADPTLNNDLPSDVYLNTSSKLTPAGFVNFFTGQLIDGQHANFQGGQQNTFTPGKTTGHSNIVTGFGIPGMTSGFVGDTSYNWGFPAQIAHGSFSGSGTLSISSATGLITLLPAVLPTTSGGSVTTHSPDTVNGQTVPVGVPEPTSIGLVGAAAVGLLSRRRRVA